MKILADRRIKILFVQILACAAGFTAVAALLFWAIPQSAAGWIWFAAICMTALILALLLPQPLFQGYAGRGTRPCAGQIHC